MLAAVGSSGQTSSNVALLAALKHGQTSGPIAHAVISLPRLRSTNPTTQNFAADRLDARTCRSPL